MSVIKLEATKQPAPQWGEYLKKFGGSIFLNHEWLESFKDKAGQPIYFLFYDHNTLQALTAGLERPLKDGNTKQLFFYSGIASAEKDPQFIEQCMYQLREYARDRKYWRVIIKSYDYCMECSNREFKEYVPFRRKEYIFDLTLDRQAIIRNQCRSTRQKIRKAKKAGLVIKEGYSEELLMKLFQLMDNTCQTRAVKGYGKYSVYCMPFLSQEVALLLLKKKNAVVHYVEKSGQILSMSFLIILAQKAYCIWMGTSVEGYKASAPYFLTHETACQLKEKGITWLNMGGVPLGKSNQGIKRFKLNMGTTAIESTEQSTDILLPHLSYLNHLLKFKRFIQRKHLPWKIKKPLLHAFNWMIRDMDRY